MQQPLKHGQPSRFGRLQTRAIQSIGVPNGTSKILKIFSIQRRDLVVLRGPPIGCHHAPPQSRLYCRATASIRSKPDLEPSSATKSTEVSTEVPTASDYSKLCAKTGKRPGFFKFFSAFPLVAAPGTSFRTGIVRRGRFGRLTQASRAGKPLPDPAPGG